MTFSRGDNDTENVVTTITEKEFKYLDIATWFVDWTVYYLINHLATLSPEVPIQLQVAMAATICSWHHRHSTTLRSCAPNNKRDSACRNALVLGPCSAPTPTLAEREHNLKQLLSLHYLLRNSLLCKGLGLVLKDAV